MAALDGEIVADIVAQNAASMQKLREITVLSAGFPFYPALTLAANSS